MANPDPNKSARDGDRSGLSVIVPALNEEALLTHTIEHLLTAGIQWVEELEIIIVNDGSTDKTPQIVDQLATDHKNVHSLHNHVNLGFGATVRKGFGAATQPYVMVCPVDYLFTLEDFDVYLGLIKYSDIVIGYRRHRRLDLSLYRRMVSSVYHVLVNFVFNLNFFDVNWIHMYRRDKLDKFLGKSNGVFLLAENIIQAKRLGLRITGVDVNYEERTAGVATGIKPKTILSTIRELFIFFLKNHRS